MFCTHPQCTSCSIHCNISAANNSNCLGLYHWCIIFFPIALHQVDSGQIFVCRANSNQRFTRNAHKPWQTCTRTNKYCFIAVFHQFINGENLANYHIWTDFNTQFFQCFYFFLYDALRQTEFRNAVHQNTASNLKCFKNGYLIAQPCQIASTSQTSRATANNSNLVPVWCNGFCLQVSVFSRIVCGKPFQTTDSDRLTLLATDTLALTL